MPKIRSLSAGTCSRVERAKSRNPALSVLLHKVSLDQRFDMAEVGPPPTLFTQTTILSLGATVALLVAAVVLAKALLPIRTYQDRIQRYTFVWLAFDALTHLYAHFSTHAEG